MTAAKIISIIIPVYNVADYVGRCLQSVMDQEEIADIKIECLIVDDCGTDESMVIVEHTLASYQGPIEFHILRRDINGGLSAARNTGIRAASGEYLYFLDSDDTITPHCIHTLWKSVTSYPGVDIVFGKTECVPDSNYLSGYLDFKKNGALKYCDDKEKIHAIYLYLPEIACNKLIRADWLHANNLYFTEGILHEDLDWHLRSYFAIGSYACAYDGRPTYLYLQRTGTITKNSAIGSERRARLSAEIYTRCYMWAPYWDAPLAREIFIRLFDLQVLAWKNPGTYHERIYRDTLTKLKNKKSGLTFLQRLLLHYIALGRPWSRPAIAKPLYRFMPIIKQ